MNLAHRDEHLVELMDDPNCDPVRLARTLRRFSIVNGLISGWGLVYAHHVRPALIAGGGRGRILDIGCGGGDVLRRLVARARRDGFTVEGVGIDPDERGLAVARAARPVGGIHYRSAFSADLVDAGESFDVVVSNHVLHHLTEGELAALAHDSTLLASRIALHSDIARGRIAYAAYAVGITPLAPGSLLRTDGLRSIRRSYTVPELAGALPERAGALPGLAGALPEWQVSRPAPFRVLARWDAAPGGTA